ncbi:transposase domain-containing protein [Herbidospora mongoliensis]|uniref:transposase domain-containing protein n=1 Tax=Herbidospora mongoliensis TaxID=688067 RepID=UPI00147129B4
MDAVLADSGRTECQLRVLLPWAGVYFVLAPALFGHGGAHLVGHKLTAATFPMTHQDHPGHPRISPSIATDTAP